MNFFSSRRDFLKRSSTSGLSLLLPPKSEPSNIGTATNIPFDNLAVPLAVDRTLDLSPAKWIWYPMQRCLPNTVVLFRKEIRLNTKPKRAVGYILGESRYLFFANGQRVQFGPAPSDPRWAEADPIDLTAYLQAGSNTIGAQVLYYGHGDGTWPIGKPGFIFRLEIEFANGSSTQIVSDGSWQTLIARSWRPGQYKRWYLRAFQEEFDARLYPHKWHSNDYVAFDNWLTAKEIDNPANKPAINGTMVEYANDLSGRVPISQLRERSVPLLRENVVKATKLAESLWVRWLRSPYEYFECLTPDAFEPTRTACVSASTASSWTVEMDGTRGAVLTFEFNEQSVGFPFFTIDAPSGTVVELMVQEAHRIGGDALLNSKFHSWSRFICRSGTNYFETFDYESLRWLQLHIHSADGKVVISNVGLRRRQYPWPQQPQFKCSDAKIQKVLEACVNTLHNSAQETIVDGMARERQQYSGDVGHQLHSIQNTMGDTLLHARFVNTFSQGMTLEGYFLDTWPAYDRLARIMERQIQITDWGPLLDHSIGFNFDCWHYYLYTGDKLALAEVMPRLVKFLGYLSKIRQPNNLLPVENLGVPTVWIDHEAYQKQRHKMCAFNLYAVAMLQRAFVPLCQANGMWEVANRASAFAKEIQEACVKTFWSSSRGTFINNQPWLGEEKTPRMCDRSLATAILFDLCPDNITKFCAQTLANPPQNLGTSYPANANWRYWALAKAGMIQPVINDLRGKWYDIESVVENNTMAEWWHVRPDSGQQWSHCPIAPLFVTYMNIAGIQPIAPAFKKAQIRPQLGDLAALSLTNHTVQGPIVFEAKGKLGNRMIRLQLPEGMDAELVVPEKEPLGLTPIGPPANGLRRFRLPGGRSYELILKTI